MEHKILDSKRGAVHYWVQKNADDNRPCIVFTHGLTANHQMFARQVDFFAEKYTVITWDVPMHGKSRPYRQFSYEDAAKKLKDILDREGIERIILVGMSMGGYVSQEFAARYPRRILGFVGLSTTPYGHEYYSRSDKWWLSRVGGISRLFSGKLLRRSIAKSASKTQFGRDLMLEMLESLSKDDIIEQMEIGYGGFLKENRDVSFDFPVIILLGEHDRTGKVKKYCTAWSKKEGFPLQIISGAAHFANADNPGAVNEEIERFVNRIS